MRHQILYRLCLVTFVVVLMASAYAQQAQQSHWASPDDKTAKFMIDMERKWAEGVCTNNGVISELLADDFQRARHRQRQNTSRRPAVPGLDRYLVEAQQQVANRRRPG